MGLTRRFKLIAHDVLAALLSVDGSGSLLDADMVDGKHAADLVTADVLTTQLLNKVDKVSGKGLSTEDYTSTEKTKLAGIAANANNYTHPAMHSADIIIDGTTNKAYTATEKTKLAGIAIGAEVNVNADWNATSGDAKIFNKPTTIEGYGITNVYTKSEVDNKVSAVYKYRGSVSTYSALPSSSLIVGDVYNVTDTGINYAWDGTAWDNLGGVVPLATATNNGLMSKEDFSKLLGVATGATANSTDTFLRNRANHTGTQSADTIVDGTTNKVYTAIEKTKLTGLSSPVSVSASLVAASWSGTSAPYTQTVTVNGMTASKNGFVDTAQSATGAQRGEARAALFSITSQGTNTITITADGTKPTVDIPITVLMLG